MQGDVADPAVVAPFVARSDHVIHAAAETHVDRSIDGPAPFLATNVTGTQVVLEACRAADTAMLMISTDEVYGANTPEGAGFTEDAPLRPRSPYAASKAAAELLCGAWRTTYGTLVTVVRGTNAFGPRQFPEKVVPVYTLAALEGRPLPVYGQGEQQRRMAVRVGLGSGVPDGDGRGSAGRRLQPRGGAGAAEPRARAADLRPGREPTRGSSPS